VLRYDASSGELYPLPGDRAHTLRSLSFRPDGRYALIGAYASRWAGYPRPHALYRCDGRYVQALLASDDEDDLVAVDWQARGPGLACGYALRPDAGRVNKALFFDGSSWRGRAWESEKALLGGAWRPGGQRALLLGEGGLALWLAADGAIEAIESGMGDNLIGPFWRPDGSEALVLKGPDEHVYTV
jgi:hypothetical protein